MLDAAAIVWVLMGTAEISPSAVGPLTLEAAVHAALQRNERAGMAAADAEAAQARLEGAGAFFMPKVYTEAGYYHRPLPPLSTRTAAGQSIVIQARNPLNGSLAVSVPILDAHGIPLYGRAQQEAAAAALGSAEAKRLLAYDAAVAFLQVLTHEQVRAAAQSRLRFAEQTLADAQGRFTAQMIRSNDVTRAEMEVAQAQGGLAQTLGEVESQYLNLEFLLVQAVSRPLGEPAGLLDEALDTPGPVAAALVDAARTRRLDLRAQQHTCAAARLAVLDPTLRWVPALGAKAQLRATNEAGFMRSVDGYAGLQLTWALYDGGTRQAEAHEASVRQRRAQLVATALTRQIAIEVHKAWAVLDAGRGAWRHAQLAAAAAQRNAEQSAALYREGLVNGLAMQDASVRLFDANVNLAKRQYGLILAYLGLRGALGLDPLGREPL